MSKVTLTSAALLFAVAVTCWYLLRAPAPQQRRLADRTEVFYLSDTLLEPAAAFPHPRTLALNGDAYLTIPAAGGPMTLSTRLFKLTISGNTELRITNTQPRTEQMPMCRPASQSTLFTS